MSEADAESEPEELPAPPSPIRKGALALALLASAVLGAAGGHAWADRAQERVHVSQLGRLARDELKATLEGGRYADAPLVLQRYQESTMVESVAWTDRTGGVRVMRGDPGDFGAPPPRPGVVDGASRVAWAGLPEGDWLRIELKSSTPSPWVPAVALVALLVGLFRLRRRS